MDKELLIYMDCCCLNRVNDDQTQDKIRIESEAIMAILFQCHYGLWNLTGSDVIEYEIMNTQDLNKKNKALLLYKIRKKNIALNDNIYDRAREIQKYGLKPFDSLHFASAEYGNVDILLTVDKDFIKIAKKINSSIKVKNPINWFMEEIEYE